MSVMEVKVPDIGDFKDVPIIEISVKPGDVVKIDDPLLTLESDKASMEVPSPSAGTVKEVLVKLGDRGKDKLIVRLEGGDVPSAAHAAPAVMHQQEAAEPPPSAAPASALAGSPASTRRHGSGQQPDDLLGQHRNRLGHGGRQLPPWFELGADHGIDHEPAGILVQRRGEVDSAA